MNFTDDGRPPLTILEIRALNILLDANGMLTVEELRTALGLELDEISEVLDALVAFGLITRFRDPEAAER